MPTGAFVTPLNRTTLAGLRAGGVPVSSERYNEEIITTVSFCCLGAELNGFAVGNIVATTYPLAGRAIACMFTIAAPFLVRKVFWFNGTTVGTDSVDVGVYTEAGSRVIAGGGALSSGANSTQETDVTDTILEPGRYWMAFAQSGATATPMQFPPAVGVQRAMGVTEMGSGAYPLPSTWTPAAATAGRIPMMGIASRTVAS